MMHCLWTLKFRSDIHKSKARFTLFETHDMYLCFAEFVYVMRLLQKKEKGFDLFSLYIFPHVIPAL